MKRIIALVNLEYGYDSKFMYELELLPNVQFFQSVYSCYDVVVEFTVESTDYLREMKNKLRDLPGYRSGLYLMVNYSWKKLKAGALEYRDV